MNVSIMQLKVDSLSTDADVSFILRDFLKLLYLSNHYQLVWYEESFWNVLLNTIKAKGPFLRNLNLIWKLTHLH